MLKILYRGAEVILFSNPCIFIDIKGVDRAMFLKPFLASIWAMNEAGIMTSSIGRPTRDITQSPQLKPFLQITAQDDRLKIGWDSLYPAA